MIDADRAAFGKVMAGLSELFDKPVSPTMLALYWQALQAYPIEAVKRAANAHCRNPEAGRFFPRIADFVAGIEGSSTDRAALAWAKVLRAVEAGGVYDSFVFDDPLIHAVLSQMGGITVVAHASTDSISYKMEQFSKQYASLSSRGALPAYPPRLVGLCEASARAKHAPLPAPVLIGEPSRCAEVEAGGAVASIGVSQPTPALAARLKALAAERHVPADVQVEA